MPQIELNMVWLLSSMDIAINVLICRQFRLKANFFATVSTNNVGRFGKQVTRACEADHVIEESQQ